MSSSSSHARIMPILDFKRLLRGIWITYLFLGKEAILDDNFHTVAPGSDGWSLVTKWEHHQLFIPGWLICSRCRMSHSSERGGRSSSDTASHTEPPQHGHKRWGCSHIGGHQYCPPHRMWSLNTHKTCWAAKSLNTLAQKASGERTWNIHRPLVYLLADDRNHPVILQTNHHYHTYHHREFCWSHEFHELDRFLNPHKRNSSFSIFCEIFFAEISSS